MAEGQRVGDLPNSTRRSVLALARGHRWLAMLESGEVKSMKEIARREGVDDSYVSRMVNLTTLAPDIVAAILDETLPPEVTLFELAAGRWCKRSSGGGLTALDCPIRCGS